jgi:UDP-N-acetylmuramate--alanine ligase
LGWGHDVASERRPARFFGAVRDSARAAASVGAVSELPLSGRRLWFVGIGGSGLSAYAQVARAWGAEVGGWDRVETPFLAAFAGERVEIAPEPVVPDGWEVVVSSAYPTVPGQRRAELLAELVSLRPSIVVTGAHGKTTTTAMLAFALRETGGDPAWIVGGEVPQLGANAGAGSGWLVVEGDESDRSVFSLRPRIAVLLNVDLDHHSEFGSRGELEQELERWLAQVPEVVRGAGLEPLDVELTVPGEHNRRNAAAALAALELAAVDRGDAIEALTRFEGVGRRYDVKGEAGGVTVVDDYAHNPAKVEAAIAAARERGAERVLVLFQPHLYSRTRHSFHGLARALATADAVAVTDVYAAREQPVAGVGGKLVLDALAELRPGMPLAWAPAPADGVPFLAGRARPGDVVLTIGAGDVDRAAPLLLEALA